MRYWLLHVRLAHMRSMLCVLVQLCDGHMHIRCCQASMNGATAVVWLGSRARVRTTFGCVAPSALPHSHP